jgi:hypothetical protein
MARTPEPTAERKTPTRIDALVFRGKTALLQTRRMAQDTASRRLRRHAFGTRLLNEQIIGESITPLWSETDPAEKFLVAGKLENLRRAAAKLDGIEVPAGDVFSFWKQVGRTSRFKGYVQGRELREGCIIPSVGGGLCQISNALYDAALQAGFEIIERHSHTQVIPGSLAEIGRDATVFWNYVDLRFRTTRAFRIEASLDTENLIVRFRGDHCVVNSPEPERSELALSSTPNSCVTCGVGECHRVVNNSSPANFGRTTFLVDEYSPEFDKYIRDNKTSNDVLLLPLDGNTFRKGNYAWTTDGFASMRQSFLVTAKRSYRSRKLAAQGAARQQNLLRMYEELAASYARRLRYDVLHLTVQQNLLPFLWRNGCLGGRTFDVLMTSLPMKEIQRSLDRAYDLHPESTTLGDFRADPDLVEAEMEALRCARRIITAHTKIASLFPRRGQLIDWKIPEIASVKKHTSTKPHIIFPATTVGRKGCYELREAIRGLDVKLILLGPIIESTNFWQGFDVGRGDEHWVTLADVVVLPAFVEHRPRRLIAAAAAGIPVIASRACGVDNVPGIRSIESGDAVLLREELLGVLKPQPSLESCLV